MSAETCRLEVASLPLCGVHLIEAGAGTGKTHTIASLYLRMLLEGGWTVQQILVVTFMKAATAELRGRIRERIKAALDRFEGHSAAPVTAEIEPYRHDPSARQRLRDALTCMDEAAIFTIHSLCQRVLQEHAFESGVLFETEFTANQSELLTAVIEDFWRRSFYGASAGLARLARDAWQTPDGLLKELGQELAREDVELIPTIPEAEVTPEAYRRLFESLQTAWADHRTPIIEGLQCLTAAGELSRSEGKYHAEALAAADAGLTVFLANPPEDYEVPDGLKLFTRQTFMGALTRKGTKNGAEPPAPEVFDLCQQILDLGRKKLIQLRAAAFQECRQALREIKEVRKVLSYDDLVQRLHEALRTPAGVHLAAAVAGQFPVALIDEFQDTDPGQYGIFRRVYEPRPECALYLIGDPKQAIYSFRGGDIFTYMQARRATRSRFTLETNWRSTERYTSAVNAFFHQRRRPFVYAEDIPYQAVRAAAEGKANREPLTVSGGKPAPFRVWFIRRTPENSYRNTITKEWARNAIAEACAFEIETLLDPASRALIGDRPLEPKDIAVLARTHREGALVQQALSARGIASVYSGRSSIFASSEAAELARMLAAIAEPQDDRALRSALATELLGKTAGWLATSDDAEWDRIFQSFRFYREDWQRRGFIAMFRRLIEEQAIPPRLMAYPDGERRLTNLLHLGELLQTASQEQAGIEGLLRWFAETRRRPDHDSDEQQLRLESDAERVQIVTLHKSKGLEYAIVFLPFCWDSKPRDGKKPFSFHDESRDHMPLVFDLAGGEDNLPQADRERLAEELRLLYVGATRARYRCYLAYGPINGAASSALAYLLHQTPDMSDPVLEAPVRMAGLDDEAMLADLRTLDAGAGLFEVADLPVPELRTASAPLAAPKLFAARRFGGSIDTSWRIASFSGLAAARQHAPAPAPAEPDYDIGAALTDETREETPPEPDSIFAFPKGAEAGVFLHEVFELLDFPEASGAVLTETVSRLLRKHGYSAEAWQPAVSTLVQDVLDTVLDCDTGLSLRAIAGDRRLNELKFHFPLGRLGAAGLNAILRDHPLHADDWPGLEFDDTRGVMLGFIDLIFEHRGRYYVVDYKSNHLGNRLEDYAPDELQSAMLAHRYDLQYLIYTVAVHRYLRCRLPGYRYRDHFGGVYYLFLRGMQAAHGASYGVYADKPDEALIERLNAVFGGDVP